MSEFDSSPTAWMKLIITDDNPEDQPENYLRPTLTTELKIIFNEPGNNKSYPNLYKRQRVLEHVGLVPSLEGEDTDVPPGLTCSFNEDLDTLSIKSHDQQAVKSVRGYLDTNNVQFTIK